MSRVLGAPRSGCEQLTSAALRGQSTDPPRVDALAPAPTAVDRQGAACRSGSAQAADPPRPGPSSRDAPHLARWPICSSACLMTLSADYGFVETRVQWMSR